MWWWSKIIWWGWRTSPTKTGCRSLACSVWRRKGCRETSLQSCSSWREIINRREADFLHGLRVTGQRGDNFNLKEGRFRLHIVTLYSEDGKVLAQLEKLWLLHPWRHSRPGWMGPWADWAGGWQSCPQQWVGTRWVLRTLPTYDEIVPSILVYNERT